MSRAPLTRHPLRWIASAAAIACLPGCGIVDAGASREAEYYDRVSVLEDQIKALTDKLDQAQQRVQDLESDEHARFIDAYLASQAGAPEAALAAWDSFLQDFPTSPLGPGARDMRDRMRARQLQQQVVETEEYRVLVDKLGTAAPGERSALIEDFLTRFPSTSRKEDLEKRLKTLGDIERLKRRYLGPEAAPESPASAADTRTTVEIPTTKP